VNDKAKPSGFTMIELLIALVIIVIIVSAVYSTYFVTAASVQKCREKLIQTQEGRSLLAKMSRQLRSLYTPASGSTVSESAEDIFGKDESSEEIPRCLSGAADDREGIILQMLTSANLFHAKDMASGIWNVKYKYLPDQDTLFYSQQPLTARPEHERRQENWLPLAKNLTSIHLQFYNGERWQLKWNSEKHGLPEAVRIDISLHGAQTQSPTFGTVADISGCRTTLPKAIHQPG